MKALQAFFVLAFVLVFTSGCNMGESPASSEATKAAISLEKGTGPSASGQARITFEGENQIFSFHARRFPDGSVRGTFQAQVQAFGERFHGEINCLSISGNIASMSGVVTGSNIPIAVGALVAFQVQDHGEGASAQDEWSDVAISLGALPDCFEVAALGDISNVPVEGGNVQVKP